MEVTSILVVPYELNVIYGRSPTDFTILTDFTSAEPAMVASTFKEDLNILKDAQTHPDPSKVCMPFLHLFSMTHSFLKVSMGNLVIFQKIFWLVRYFVIKSVFSNFYFFTWTIIISKIAQ